MFDDVKQQVESTVVPLVRGILDDTQTLLRQELHLAKVEVREDAVRLRGAAVSFGIAAGLGAIASVLLALMLVQLLVTFVDDLPLWGAYAIVGVFLVVVAAILFGGALKRMKSVKVIPEQTVETMRENVQWIQRNA